MSYFLLWWIADASKLLQTYTKINLGSHFNPYNFLHENKKYAIFVIDDPNLLDYNRIKCHDQHFINLKVILIQNMGQTQKKPK